MAKKIEITQEEFKDISTTLAAELMTELPADTAFGVAVLLGKLLARLDDALFDEKLEVGK